MAWSPIRSGAALLACYLPARRATMVCPQTGVVDRAVWEICLLNSLSQALKSGNVNVPHSRAFQPLETYLLDREQWAKQKAAGIYAMAGSLIPVFPVSTRPA